MFDKRAGGTTLKQWHWTVDTQLLAKRRPFPSKMAHHGHHGASSQTQKCSSTDTLTLILKAPLSSAAGHGHHVLNSLATVQAEPYGSEPKAWSRSPTPVKKNTASAPEKCTLNSGLMDPQTATCLRSKTLVVSCEGHVTLPMRVKTSNTSSTNSSSANSTAAPKTPSDTRVTTPVSMSDSVGVGVLGGWKAEVDEHPLSHNRWNSGQLSQDSRWTIPSHIPTLQVDP